MRKAQFFSLTGVLLIVLLVVMIRTISGLLVEQQEFRAERSQVKALDNFARNFENLDVPQMLDSTARFALVSATADGDAQLTGPELVALMRSGDARFTGTDDQFNIVEQTMPTGGIDGITLDYRLVGVEQPDPWTMLLDFRFDYTIDANNARWSGTDLEHQVQVPVIGITHPDYGQIIQEDWTAVTSGTDCVIHDVFDVALIGSCSDRQVEPLPPAT